MKVILFLLAISCTALAMPDVERFKRDIQAHKDSCPGKCIMTDKYRDWFTQALPKAREFGKKLAEGETAPSAIPILQADKFDDLCRELGNIRTCVGACNDPADADRKTKAEAILQAANNIVCDAEIKGKATCLQDVAKMPSPTCNTQCEQFKAPILEAYNQYKTTGQRDWDKAKNAGKNVCLLINCRLKCRKNDYTTKCGDDGYGVAKKLVKNMATLAKTTHAQFRPTQNFPEECNPEKVVEGA